MTATGMMMKGATLSRTKKEYAKRLKEKMGQRGKLTSSHLYFFGKKIILK
jgi:hypothetical protein